MLAQLTYVVARSAGVKQIEPEDFDLFGPKPEAAALASAEGANVFAALANSPGVKVLGRKRREKQQPKKDA